MDDNDLKNQARLKELLQQEPDASKLEHMAAVLLGRLLDVPIAVAKSGFQHGGDAGPAGRQGRRFRVECKKYGDTTRLSDRELLGEISQARSRDEALEAWILVATREVSEQVELGLTQEGEASGIPVVILDWKAGSLSSLAALCAFAPDIVAEFFSPESGDLARALQPACAHAIDQLKRDLQSWSLGFEQLRALSHAKLERIWSSPRTSNAELGQDVAVGAEDKKIRRTGPHAAFDEWWRGKALSDAPLAIVGWDGVGKTWAALDWLVDRRDEHPIVIVIASSSVAGLAGVSETTVKRFLADRLYELGDCRDRAHWLRRLDRLLSRPMEEGPVMTVFLDGLNQEPSAPWLQLLKVLQSPTFEGRLRVMISTRKHHLADKLSNLRGLVVGPVVASVDVYDVAPGGELDQMLAFENLKQSDLHDDLLEMARTPRLFKLVVRFRERVGAADKVTVHRLLWEYGRDTLGVRAGRSFNEDEWREWLKTIAKSYRDGHRAYSLSDLSATTSRADLTQSDVFARLSDIIDGRFVAPNAAGDLQLSATIAWHALGAALLSHLDTASSPTFDSIDGQLAQWLDPIAGLDQRAEILRAAVSILLERDGVTQATVAGVLVTAWLQTQNISDQHRRELAALAANLPSALLEAVEHSSDGGQASARSWAVKALRAIPRDDVEAFALIVERLRAWLLSISRDADPHHGRNLEAEKHRAKRLIDRVGMDASGPKTVLGLPLNFVDTNDDDLGAVAASILEDFPLASASRVFEAAALSSALSGHDRGWDRLKWLCLLNEKDPHQTAATLRALSNEVRLRSPEPGVNPGLPGRVAALLLWLTGFEEDEEQADQIDSGIDNWVTYEKDYLANPSRSFFYPLERRHVEEALLDKDVSLHARLQSTKDLWLDPSFEPPAEFVDELRGAALNLNVGQIRGHRGTTSESLAFEAMEPALALCAPDLLALTVKRELRDMAFCQAEARYWTAIRATDRFILVTDDEADSANILRRSTRDNDSSREAFASAELLILEIRNQSATEQIVALIDADLKFILLDVGQILKEPTAAEIDALLVRFEQGTEKQRHDLLILLSICARDFSDYAWAWVEEIALTSGRDDCGVAFKMLAHVNEARFGRVLMNMGWSWSAAEPHLWINHYGSGALLAASLSVPFDQIAPRLAPWRLLEAARRRGCDPTEIRLAAEIFSHVLAADKVDEIDPGSQVLVNRTNDRDDPFAFSIRPFVDDGAGDNSLAAFRLAMDFNAQKEIRKRALDTAVNRINEARKAGAELYLTNVAVEDIDMVLSHAADFVDLWLQGLTDQTIDFRRRVRLAQGVYLSLCEALLIHEPARGSVLWRALRETLTISYLGPAGVDELIHLAFRGPDSVHLEQIRDELFDLGVCNSDGELFDLSIAASMNGKTEWLARHIAEDQSSSLAWRRKRAIVLSGFQTDNELPVSDAWAEGETISSYEGLRRKTARRRYFDACAHHWWRAYLAATTSQDAYADWVLFLRSVDRRARIWLHADVAIINDTGAFYSQKMAQVELNRQEMKRVMEKRVGKLGDEFLGRKIVDDVGPWGKRWE